MNPAMAQFELRVLKLIDAAVAKKPVESSYVELKATWPEAKQAARIVGGMCNAAGGQPVLLLIGVDEKAGRITNASNVEVADWNATLRAEFDREAPSLIHTLPVHKEDTTVVALLFDSSRAPYVLKNPVANQPGAGPVQFEVPWREGNAIRSARREHLLRILEPEARSPVLEILSGSMMYRPGENDCWDYDLDLELFASVRGGCTLIAHRSSFDANPNQLSPSVTTARALHFGFDLATGEENRTVLLGYSQCFRFRSTGLSQCIGPVLPPEATFKINVAIDGSDRFASAIARMRVQSASPRVVAYVAIQV